MSELQANLILLKHNQMQPTETLKQVQARNQKLDCNKYCLTSRALIFAPAATSAASALIFPFSTAR